MHVIGSLHLWTPNYKLKTVQLFIEKNSHEVDPGSSKQSCSRVNCIFNIIFLMLYLRVWKICFSSAYVILPRFLKMFFKELPHIIKTVLFFLIYKTLPKEMRIWNFFQKLFSLYYSYSTYKGRCQTFWFYNLYLNLSLL